MLLPGRAWQWHGHCSSDGLGRGYGVKTAAKGEGCFRRASEAEGVVAPISCPRACGESAGNDRNEDLLVQGVYPEDEGGSG